MLSFFIFFWYTLCFNNLNLIWFCLSIIFEFVQDEGLDIISEGLDTLKDLAHEMSEVCCVVHLALIRNCVKRCWILRGWRTSYHTDYSPKRADYVEMVCSHKNLISVGDPSLSHS